jgi:putative aldouronate transport system substrate-binding protein
VTAAFAKTEFQDGLRYLHQLYSEGLIYPDSFTMNQTDRVMLNSQKYENVIGAIPFCVAGGWGIGTRETGQPERYIDYEPIPPIKGPKGVQTTQYNPYGQYSEVSLVIPTTCKNPALVLRLLDYFYTDDGLNLMSFGPPEIGWTKADPGAVGPDGGPAKYKRIDIKQGDPFYNNKGFSGAWANGGSLEYRNSVQTASDILAPDGSGMEGFLYQKTLSNYAPYSPPDNTIIPPLFYEQNVVSELATLTTNINTYVEESIARFIRGDLNVETDWARFQTELKNLGIDRYLQIIQNTYDKSAFAKK